MDGSTSQKIADLLKDPETLSRIASIAGELTKGQSASPAIPTQPEKSVLPSAAPPSGDKTALLKALRPLLRDDKRNKIDKLINALAIASVVRNLKGKGGTDIVQQ